MNTSSRLGLPVFPDQADGIVLACEILVAEDLQDTHNVNRPRHVRYRPGTSPECSGEQNANAVGSICIRIDGNEVQVLHKAVWHDAEFGPGRATETR